MGDPDEPHTPGWELVFQAEPGELVVRKDEPDTFAANPNLAETLRRHGVDRIVVAGMQSEYCVQATSRGALQAAFGVVLLRGGHATYGDSSSAAELSAEVERELMAEGATVVSPAVVEFH